MPSGLPTYPFELRLAKARDEINEALRMGVPPMAQAQPGMMPQQPMQQPMGQMQPGMMPPQQMPQQMPMGQPQMQQPMQQPQQPRPFQEGGLATSLRTNPIDHDRDVDFVSTRNQHLREMVGKQAHAKGGLAVAAPKAMSDEELAKAFTSEENNSAIIGEVNRRIKAKLLDKFGGDEAAANQFLRSTNDPLGILLGQAAYAKGGGAWTRKEGKNPEGGLNAVGRASLRAQGHDIKPPVSAKQAKKSPKAAARRKSFCARMSGMPGPMKDEKGRPTRKALSLRKWDCR